MKIFPDMGLNPNFVENILRLNRSSGISDTAADFLAASLVPRALLFDVHRQNRLNLRQRSGDRYLAYWLESKIFERNQKAFCELVSKVNLSAPDVGEPISEEIVSNFAKTELVAQLEAALRRNPEALEAFAHRTDILSEPDASQVLISFIGSGVFEGRDDLAQTIADKIHRGSEKGKNIPGFQSQGMRSDKKISTTEIKILGELTLAGFTIHFPEHQLPTPSR